MHRQHVCEQALLESKAKPPNLCGKFRLIGLLEERNMPISGRVKVHVVSHIEVHVVVFVGSSSSSRKLAIAMVVMLRSRHSYE